MSDFGLLQVELQPTTWEKDQFIPMNVWMNIPLAKTTLMMLLPEVSGSKQI